MSYMEHLDGNGCVGMRRIERELPKEFWLIKQQTLLQQINKADVNTPKEVVSYLRKELNNVDNILYSLN